MPIAGVEEQFHLLRRGDQSARGVQVAALLGEVRVGIHAVHLDGNARRPRVAEFRHRGAYVEQQRSLAPARVWASCCAGMAPSEKPA